MTTSGPTTRKRVDANALSQAQRRARRRVQYREASRRKRARKAAKLTAQSAPGKLAVLQQLSSGEFPHSRPVEALCKLGLSDKEICSVLGVSPSTFTKWQRLSPSLRAAVQRGRRVADTHVAESLFMQAVGFSVPVEKIFYNSRSGRVTRVPTEKYYPPNAVAAIFWLKNRYAEFWRDHKGDDTPGSGSPSVVNQVKFVLVQAPSGSSARDPGEEKVIDGNYRILSGDYDSSPGDPPGDSGDD